MEKNEKMRGLLGEWLEKSGKITEVITFKNGKVQCLKKRTTATRTSLN